MWTGQLDFSPADVVREAAHEVESLGYRALWTGEAVGREVMTAAQLLLAATDSLVVATGIANIWARDAYATAAAQLALGEAYPDRFVLGIGASHKLLLDVRGGGLPTSRSTHMRAYLDGMDAGYDVYRAVPAGEPAAATARRPRAEDARALAGSAPTAPTPTSCRRSTPRGPARSSAPDKLLVPEQVCVLVRRPDGRPRDRPAAHRRRTCGCRTTPPTSSGSASSAEDFADGGNDRLVDTICAWGDVDAVAARVQAHLDAGADHVAVQVLVDDRRGLPRREWAELAPALLAL